jgi:predicted permease
MRDFTPEGYQVKGDEAPTAICSNVGPGYFKTMGIPLLSGREFTGADRQEPPNAVIVNEKLARRFWPGQDPVGKRISWGYPFDPRQRYFVVGVAGNHKFEGMREDVPITIYEPIAQEPPGEVALHVRTSGDPAAAIAAIRAEVRALDRNLPVYQVKTMAAQMDESLSRERLMATLSASFAGLALLLAAIGLYGVMAYSVTRRTRELGVRMALGAASSDVVRLVLRESAVLVLIGLGVGLPVAWVASKLVTSLLYGMSPRDPAIYAAVTALLAFVALLAAWLPARRAARIAPATALRCD